MKAEKAGERAVEALKAGLFEPAEEAWSPTIVTGAPVTMPEHYGPDLSLRMQLYRRLSSLQDESEIEAFGVEMIDRFGPMPDEVRQLMRLVSVKLLCRRAHVEKIEAGAKGIVISFRDNSFANPQGLVKFIAEQGRDARVRPDMKIVFVRDIPDPDARLESCRRVLRQLVEIAEKGKKKAA